MDHACASTSTSDALSCHIAVFNEVQGWVYFYSRYLKVVTDQDIRKPEIYEVVNRNTVNYPLPELDTQMEIQLLVQTTGIGGSTDADVFIGTTSGIILHTYLHQQGQFLTHPTRLLGFL
ncbi:hypothetical protein C0993_002591 [Termitomyces sp. T159_Od127]|nr:hypothetical protein C0993_002591 [Termitomyces sp. T159_Od127]